MMPIEYMQEHEGTIQNALVVARDRYREYAVEARKVAALLSDGIRVPMFAEGEAGAKSALRLAERFDSQAADCTSALDDLADLGDE